MKAKPQHQQQILHPTTTASFYTTWPKARMPPLTFSDELMKNGPILTGTHALVPHTTLASLAIGLNSSYASTSPICFLITFIEPSKKFKHTTTNVPALPAPPIVTIHISQSDTPFGQFSYTSHVHNIGMAQDL
jgi:hypothetical protein